MKGICFFAIACLCCIVFGCSKQEAASIEELSSKRALTSPDDPVVTVSFEKKQKIRLGIDAERLWWWRPAIKDDLAQVAVGELQADYVRVAINCAYEREEGVIKETTYNGIVEMMNAMKTASPDINFFASPRPLKEAYTNSEKAEIWGHKNNVPWSPYPAWIQEWDSVGTKTMDDGTVVPRWKKGDFHVAKLVQYYADYLNLMKTKGFDIAFLDVSNEQTIITPAYCKYIYDNLPEKLNAGVQIPDLVAPSTYSVRQGFNWLDTLDFSNNEQHGFRVASAHNTGNKGNDGWYVRFADKAHSLGKEAWNTELHKWTGLNLHDDIMNSDVFWRHLRAGFNGIDTWLFFGPLKGRAHPMVWSHPDGRIIKTGKYHIFKQVVNNANGGKYVKVSRPSDNAVTAAFMKDDILSVWILNKDTASLANTKFEMGNRDISGKTIDVVKWHGDLPDNAGTDSTFVADNRYHFNYDIDGESLYFFKIDLAD